MKTAKYVFMIKVSFNVPSCFLLVTFYLLNVDTPMSVSILCELCEEAKYQKTEKQKKKHKSVKW